MFSQDEETLGEEEASQMTYWHRHADIYTETLGAGSALSMCIFSLKVVLSETSNSIVERKEMTRLPFFPSKLPFQSEVSHSLKIRSCSDLLCSGAINYSVSHFCLFVLVLLGVERLTLMDIKKIIQLHLSHHPLWLKPLWQGTSPDYMTQPDVAIGYRAMKQH